MLNDDSETFLFHLEAVVVVVVRRNFIGQRCSSIAQNKEDKLSNEGNKQNSRT